MSVAPPTGQDGPAKVDPRAGSCDRLRFRERRSEPLISPAPLLSRFAAGAGVVTLRQTFVRRCHWVASGGPKTMDGSGRYPVSGARA